MNNDLPKEAEPALALFPGFQQQMILTTGAKINTLVGGSGPPLCSCMATLKAMSRGGRSRRGSRRSSPWS